MKKISALLLIFTLFTLVSCNVKIYGTLNVFEDFSLIDKKDKLRTFEVTSYPQVKVKVKSENSVELKVKLNGKKRKFRITTDSDVAFPEYSGEVFYPADQNNQNYDLLVNVDTKTTIGPTRVAYESCIRYEERLICNNNGCYYQTVPVNGERRVVFHYVIKDIKAIVEFFTPRTERVVANFEGERKEKTRIVEHSGYCRTGGW